MEIKEEYKVEVETQEAQEVKLIEMNINEILEYISEVGDRHIENINISFDLINQVVRKVVRDSKDAEGKIDHTFVRLFTIIDTMEALLLSAGISYVSPQIEDDTMPELFVIYDELVRVNKAVYNADVILIKDLIAKTVAQEEAEWNKLGMFEGKIIDVMERATKTIEGISSTLGDKGKLKGILKLVKKEFPQLDGILESKKDVIS